MRSDMAKMIVERPRHGSNWRLRRGHDRQKWVSASVRAGMRARHTVRKRLVLGRAVGDWRMREPLRAPHGEIDLDAASERRIGERGLNALLLEDFR